LNTVLTNLGVDLTGYTLSQALGVSDDGTKIVGIALGPSGTEAFIADISIAPPPEDDKVTICHKPGTSAEKTKQVPEPALKGHLKHGDIIGACQ